MRQALATVRLAVTDASTAGESRVGTHQPSLGLAQHQGVQHTHRLHTALGGTAAWAPEPRHTGP